MAPLVTNSGGDASVLSPDETYAAYAFIVTPECPLHLTGNSCRAMGVAHLSSNFLILFPEARNIGRSLGHILMNRIRRSLAPGFQNDNGLDNTTIETPLLSNGFLAELLLAGRVFIFCPPCFRAITLALAICHEQSSAAIPFQVRVDHRLRCNCAPDDEPMMERIERIVDTIFHVDSGYPHGERPLDWEAYWIQFIDREYLERLLYEPGERSGSTPEEVTWGGATTTPTWQTPHGIRNAFSLDSPSPGQMTWAIVLGDVICTEWTMNSLPLIQSIAPSDGRSARAQVYCVEKNVASDVWERRFLGTYTA